MRLTRLHKLLYATGSLGVALSYQAFGTYIQFFYIDILGLKAALVGTGWSIYGIWNAVNDPLAGYASDRTSTRLGRRIPWLIGSILPMSLFFYLLWVPPAPLVAAGQVPLFVYFMAGVLIFDLLWTIVAMNWTSLFPEMITEPADRANVSGLRQFFSVLGLLVGVALPPVLVGADWAGRGSMAVLLASVTAISLAISLLGSRENPAAKAYQQPAFLPAVKTTLKNASFRWFLVANLHKEFIYSLLTASVPFWAKYVLNIREPVQLGGVMADSGLQNALLLGLAFVMAVPGLPIWTAVARRFGGARGWQVAQATFAASLVLVFLANDFFQGAAATAVLGLSLAGLLVFPDLLVADIVDEDEAVTGARREGMYFGINGFVIRLAFTMQGLTMAAALTLSGYVPASAADLFPAQPALAVLGIRALMAVVPMLASSVIVLCLARYPLQGERLAQLRLATLSRTAAVEAATGH
jgi:glycoside/pentoside/hexuronide:cation symporter, GPH family